MRSRKLNYGQYRRIYWYPILTILVILGVVLSCGKNKLESNGDGEVIVEFVQEGGASVGIDETFRIQAAVRSKHSLKSISYALIVDSLPRPEGTPITVFSDPTQYSVDYSFRVTELFTGFQITAEDVNGVKTSVILPVSVSLPELAIVFPESSNDTIYVNVLEPEVKFRVLSSTNLQRVSANRLHSNGGNVEVLRMENFSNPQQFEYTLTSANGINFSDLTLVKIRVFADNSNKSAIATVSLSMYSKPVVTFSQTDTLRVNVVDPNKPSPEYVVSSSGLNSITAYLLYKDGSVQQHGNPIASPSGILYNGIVTGINYTEDVVGIKIVAEGLNGYSGESILPVYCYRDETIPPIITHLQPQTSTIYGSLNPMIRFRVESLVGLKRLTFYRVLTNEDELLLKEVTSFNNNKDYVGEVPGLQQSYYSSLAGVAVLAEDVNGKWTRQVLNVNRAAAMDDSEQIAFPGAEGGGRKTTGGRGGQVIYVTTLEDNNSKGSLRWALTQTGARTIVFKVAGTISLNSNLNITMDDVTIAGQTAPGDGITVRNYPLNVNASNVIMRYIRSRMGDLGNNVGDGDDAMGGRGKENIIVDHISASWCTDECVSFYQNKNFTLQWSIISESLKNSKHSKGAHGYGAIWGGTNASFHHNLMVHHDSRTPRIGGATTLTSDYVDLRNNVMYNWSGNGCYGAEGTNMNIVNNYYKAGPATPRGSRTAGRIIAIDKSKSTELEVYDKWGKYYVDGNVVDGNGDVYAERATANNWNDGVYNQFHSSYGTVSDADKAAMKVNIPFLPGEMHYVTTHTASIAYERVLGYAGSVFSSDALDVRYVEETRDRTAKYKGSNTASGDMKWGIIDSQEDVGGWPELKSYTAPIDTDSDGMPDAWEIANGLNPNQNDANGNNLSSNYTNLEMYLNSLVEHITKEQVKQ